MAKLGVDDTLPAAALVMSLLILPRAKGVFIAAIWKTRAPGSELP